MRGAGFKKAARWLGRPGLAVVSALRGRGSPRLYEEESGWKEGAVRALLFLGTA